MPNRNDWRVALAMAHPALIDLFFLAFFAGAFALRTTGEGVQPYGMATIFICIGAVIVWSYAVHSAAVARDARGLRDHTWIFVLALVALIFTCAVSTVRLVGGDAGLLISLESAGLWVSVALYVISIWLAARSLHVLERGSQAVHWYEVLGTFLLAFYLFIGTWFLHGRLKRALPY